MIRALHSRKKAILFLGLGMVLLLALACASQLGTPEAPVQVVDRSVPQGGVAEASLPSAVRAGFPTQMQQGIWVSGRGEATAVPDLAILNLGVESFGSTVAEARSDAAEAMGQVMKVVAGRNIADRDVQTKFFNINPRYSTREITRCVEPDEPASGVETSVQQVLPGVPEGPTLEIVRPRTKDECFKDRERVLIGYQVTNQLTIKLRDLDGIGELIDQVTEAGGDLIRFQGINFTIDDTKELKDQARIAAIEDLRARANQVAALSGVKLGALINISESGGSQQRPVFESVARGAFAMAAAPLATSISTGELEVVVNMQALFAIE
ncbi:MAG: SIMPL domain-containing protein [Chloroflexi bacterium]|nr:SIMPL domain-containing protein [Chloroflexota bacterium]MCI0785566.1 SIMPL domain-containing protein [Chloroflexota bacterium]